MILEQHIQAPPAPARVPAPRRGQLAASVGAVVTAVITAFLASLCCIGPVLFVTLGVGAGLASRFEPLRPLFTVLTLALLGIGFYTVYGRRRMRGDATCATGGACAVPRDRSRDRILLWSATVVAIIVLTFPQWSLLFV